MKILHLIHKPQNRGAETFACQLANHQSRLGHEVKVVAVFWGEALLPYRGEILSLNANPSRRLFDFASWNRLSKIINDFNPDILQANAGDTLKYAVFSKRMFGWKTPIIFRNASEIGQYLNSTYQKLFNKYLYRQVTGIASVSRASKADFLKNFSFSEKNTSVITVGLEPDIKLQNFSFKPQNKQHIVHVGGFSYEKNHIGLIDIFKIILGKRKNVHLHLVGDGPLKPEIEALVAKNGLTQNISFYGFVNNPLSYISAADLLILPSIIEGLPGVLLEAMYLKTPVVANNVGGISEIVPEGSGNLIEKNDNSAFAERILTVLDNPDPVQMEKVSDWVKENFMNNKLAEEFIKFYRRFV